MDKYSQKASFEKIKDDWEAVRFHALKFEMGYRYTLARLCYQLYELDRMKRANSSKP